MDSSATRATPNVDAGEVAKFDDLAHRWWDADGEFKPLHRLNPLRLAWIEAQTPIDGRRVLDVGCGGGLLAEAMARRGADVTGIDLADKPLKVARLHALAQGVRGVAYRQVAVEALADEAPGTFDVVTCMEMLEHVPDPASVVRACATLLKPGGHLVLSTLQRTPKAWLMAIVAAEYVMRMLPRGTHEYAKLIRSDELAAMVRDAGLAPTAVKGVGYQPLTDRFALTDDASVNYMMAARKA